MAATTPIVTPASPADVERIVAAFLLAFCADPIVRWIYPDPEQYFALFPAHVRAFGGHAFTQGTAQLAEGGAGAALWLPPGIAPDAAALEASLPAGPDAEFHPVFEQIGTYHPSAPHWHLTIIGVDPTHQGRGCGAALMHDTLRRCDQDHVAVYVESTNPANIPFYQRHGFELLGTIQAGSSPPLFPMLRAAR